MCLTSLWNLTSLWCKPLTTVAPDGLASARTLTATVFLLGRWKSNNFFGQLGSFRVPVPTPALASPIPLRQRHILRQAAFATFFVATREVWQLPGALPPSTGWLGNGALPETWLLLLLLLLRLLLLLCCVYSFRDIFGYLEFMPTLLKSINMLYLCVLCIKKTRVKRKEWQDPSQESWLYILYFTLRAACVASSTFLRLHKAFTQTVWVCILWWWWWWWYNYL